MSVNQKKIGYARVSTDDQNLDLQQDALMKGKRSTNHRLTAERVSAVWFS